MKLLFLLACAALLLGACSHPSNPTEVTVPMDWHPVDSLNAHLPDHVRLYAGRNDTLPLRAWYVHIEPTAAGLPVEIIASDDTTDNRETTSSFAHDLDACVTLNGGYFTMGKTPADHVGLLWQDEQLLASATGPVTRYDLVRYETARAALGFTHNGKAEITWATTRRDTLYTWPAPPDHDTSRVAPPPDYTRAQQWIVEDALGAGPAILKDGQLRVTVDEEIFFGTSIPAVHPRSAAGLTATGALILMVVDGRQENSRGVSLEELADLMLQAGAVDALNLDGGGSSTLVVAGQRVNLPAGAPVERQVMSAVAVFCEL